MLKKQKRDKFKIDRSKEGKEKRTFEGVIFDSEMELKFYRDYLLPLQKKGEIISIKLQPKYLLQEKFVKNGKTVLPIYYIGDFEVVYKDGSEITFDTKGLPTEGALLKLKMFNHQYRDKILNWVAYSAMNGGWIDYFELKKIRLKNKKEKDAKKNG